MKTWAWIGVAALAAFGCDSGGDATDGGGDTGSDGAVAADGDASTNEGIASEAWTCRWFRSPRE